MYSVIFLDLGGWVAYPEHQGCVEITLSKAVLYVSQPWAQGLGGWVGNRLYTPWVSGPALRIV